MRKLEDSDKKQTSLTPKQIRFCKEYVKDLNATQASIRAGYSPNGANVGASRMLAKPSLQTYIAHLEDNVAKELGISHRYVLQKIKDGLDMCKDNPSAMFKGLELLGKHLGTFDKDKAELEDRPAFVGIQINMGPKPSVELIHKEGPPEIIDA